jgi:Zn-dependent M28 family amino/carboxypeptidase
MRKTLSAEDGLEIATRSRRIVETLAGDFPSRNGVCANILQQASEFIENEFVALGCTVDSQTYRVGSTTVRNLIVEQRGQLHANPCIVLGAHYDTVLDTPGADDNASGVVGILELARLLKDYPNERTIYFVAFTLEEPPYFYTPLMGSRMFANRLKLLKTNVRLMVSLEMIGYASAGVRQVYPFPLMRQLRGYPKDGNFIGIVGNIRTGGLVKFVRRAMRAKCNIGVESLSAPGFVPPLYLSDHSSFWRFGFPALMITDTAFLRNPHYHQPSDTAESLNYHFLAEVVKGLYHAVIMLDRLH